MRFNTTIAHSQMRSAWEDADAKQNAFAEAGDDGTSRGGSEDADRAYEAETGAMCNFLRHPSTTPAEIQDKIAFMRERGPLAQDNLCWNESDMTATLDCMERDLMQMARPNVSPAVNVAFLVWSEAHEEFWSRSEWPDDELARLGEAEDLAATALHEQPCTTPGDFIVKAYVELMSEYGAQGHGTDGLEFLVDGAKISHRPDQTRLRDIMDCDLGCCLVALGRSDFDARRWMIQAERFEKRVTVTLSGTAAETKRGLAFGMDGTHSQMEEILQRLTANGLRMVSRERCVSIADEIEANWPLLVLDYRTREVQAA